MPPKKKRKGPVPSKLGKKMQYLTDNFNALPDDPTDLKNGHVLFLYKTKEKSPTQTNTTIMENYSCKSVRPRLLSLLNRESKLRESVMNRYKACCEDAFVVEQDNQDPNASGPSGPGPSTPGPSAPPGPSTPGQSLNGIMASLMTRQKPVVTIFSDVVNASTKDKFLDLWKTRLCHVPYNILDFQTPTEQALVSLQDAEIIMADHNLVSPILSRLPKIKWLQLTSAGIDNLTKVVDPKHFPPNFALMTRMGKAFGPAMAEYVIGQMIAHERHFPEMRKAQEQKEWTFPTYRSLEQLTMGVIGLGDIGEEIARLCKAFHMKVWGLGRRDLPLEKISKHVDEYRHASGLSELLADCDYICNVLPNTPATTDLLSGDVLSNCTKQPVFVNVGRGTVISEETIMKALDQGWISHAILDVFRTEPVPVSSPLWSSPKVTMSPHVSGSLFYYMLIDIMEENYTRYVNGEPLKYTVNWKDGY